MSRQLGLVGGRRGASDDNRGETVLLARMRSGSALLPEQVLDRDALADLVYEAIEESQRARGADAQTTWWDAAAAADLILFHVTQLAVDLRSEV